MPNFIIDDLKGLLVSHIAEKKRKLAEAIRQGEEESKD